MTSTALVIAAVSPDNLARVEGRKAELRAYADALASKPLVITTEEAEVAFSKALTDLHDTEKTLEENRKADKRPHLDAGAAVDALYAEPLALAAKVKTTISRSLGAYRQEKERKRQAALAAAQALAQAQAREAALVAQAQAEAAAKAAARATVIDAPIAMAPPAVVPVTPSPAVAAAASAQRALIVAGSDHGIRIGGTSDAEEIEIEIIDAAAVPRDFCKPHEPLIRAALKKGVTEIAGVKITRRAVVRATGR